jgi:hypothetical protein
MRRVLGASALMGSLAFVVLVGCGEESDPIAPPATNGSDAATTTGDGGGLPTGPSPTTPGAASDYCRETASKFITAYLACCDADDQQRSQYKLLAGVYAKLDAECPVRLGDAIAKGRLTYDQSAAAQCYPAYQSFLAGGVCGGDYASRQLPADLATCKSVFAGAVAEGGGCRGDHECVDGLTCVGSTPSSDGTCKTPPSIGETCGDGVADGGQIDLSIRFGFGTHPKCAAGAYCSSRRCKALVAQGQTCFQNEECQTGLRCFLYKCGTEGPSDLDGPCKSVLDCKTGLYCSAPIGQTGTCKTKKTEGSPCTSIAGECRGLCDKPDGGTAGTCASFCSSG